MFFYYCRIFNILHISCSSPSLLHADTIWAWWRTPWKKVPTQSRAAELQSCICLEATLYFCYTAVWINVLLKGRKLMEFCLSSIKIPTVRHIQDIWMKTRYYYIASLGYDTLLKTPEPKKKKVNIYKFICLTNWQFPWRIMTQII